MTTQGESWDSLRQRFRVITVPLRVIEVSWEDVRALMVHWIILRCEFRYANLEFEYYAVSPGFERIKFGWKAPEYRIEINYAAPGKPAGVRCVSNETP
jgi:hypothetical protein